MDGDAPDIPSCAEARRVGIRIPDLLVELEAAVGVEETRAFLLRFGGRRIAVGKNPNAGSPAVVWLRAEVGHGDLLVPFGPLGRAARLRWAIYRLAAEGRSVNQIAGLVGCHRRTVETAQQKLRQLGLLHPKGHAR
jgi:hypothetical protein